jgi:hypothetical protein
MAIVIPTERGTQSLHNALKQLLKDHARKQLLQNHGAQ